MRSRVGVLRVEPRRIRLKKNPLLVSSGRMVVNRHHHYIEGEEEREGRVRFRSLIEAPLFSPLLRGAPFYGPGAGPS